MYRISMCVLAGAGSVVLAQDIGPSTTVQPYALPVAPGVRTVSVLTVGESPADGSGYRLVGHPDGLGAFANADGTFTLLMNHELGSGEGIVRRHGAKGAMVSEWTLGPDLAVLTGRDLIHTTSRYDKPTQSFVAQPFAMDRFCSADLAAPGAYRYGLLGTDTRIFMNGEEHRPPSAADHGRAFAHVIDAEGAATYELPWMGRMSFETVVACPTPQLKTLAFGSDDANLSTSPSGTPSELYLYVGEKRLSGTELEKAGLVGGTLYGLRVPGTGGGESNAFAFGSTEYVASARFELVSFGDVSDRSGVELQTESIAQNIFRFQRIEDGAWDPRPGHEGEYYFNTTGNTTTNYSRVWRVKLDDVTHPELGGEITSMLHGDEGHQMLDNIAIDRFGHALLQEDPGGSARLSRIWQLNLDTGAFKWIAEMNGTFFTQRAPDYLTSNEESSGIIDASPFLGPGWFLFDVQAHYSTDVETDEGGQLIALFNPDSVCPGDRNADGVLDNGDINAFIAQFLGGDPAADLTGDGYLDFGDIGAFVQAFLTGCGS